jgi:hypothetical protein
LVSDIEGGTYTEDILEQSAEENIWPKRDEVTFTVRQVKLERSSQGRTRWDGHVETNEGKEGFI